MIKTIRTTLVGFFSLFLHPGLLLRILVQEFLPWYLWREPIRLMRGYVEYAKAFYEIISIGFLLRTLFSPWKGIVERAPTGFQWELIMQAIAVNLVTRGIGMVIRLFAIILSLAMQVIVLATFIVIFLAWFAFPVLFVAGVGFALTLI
ncbi:MAG: hypothetical protein PHE68_01855 [Candidatus Peribacteraceae bacterium]|nr:hypothetical protein [Candidatus Peribacteraceae bacterium]MDD5074657.1 hypothetical protein [Candidatus Peribacteraceae bacterium]